jgi:hypothetical protein
MMCCDPRTTQEEHDEMHAGQCPDCGADVDANGYCVETDDCMYSPKECNSCGYCPCDESC